MQAPVRLALLEITFFSPMPGIGFIRLQICFYHQTFIDSSALLMSLMVFQLVHVKQRLLGLFFRQGTVAPVSSY